MRIPEDGRYGVWAGNPKGNAEDKIRCVVEVFPPGRGEIHHQCGKMRGHGPGKRFCAQHNPTKQAETRAARDRAEECRAKLQRSIELEGKALAKRMNAGYYVLFDTRTLQLERKMVVEFDVLDRLLKECGR